MNTLLPSMLSDTRSAVDLRRVDRDLASALRIDGWLSDGEAFRLWMLAYAAVGPIVEIGSYFGRSTSCLALGNLSGSRQLLYAVDPFTGPTIEPTKGELLPGRPSALGYGVRQSSPEMLTKNLIRAGVPELELASGRITVVPLGSREALAQTPAQIGLLFVDGRHDYAGVREDLDLYLPRVPPGGMVALHDVVAGDPGVVRAADECLGDYPTKWPLVGRVDSLVVWQRAVHL